MSGVSWTGLVIGCGVLSVILVEVVRRAALRRDVLDVPNARSSHVAPVPRGGGLGLVGAVALAWGGAAAVAPEVRAGWALAVGALLIAAVSAADDVRTLRSGPRFAVQAVAAMLVTWETGGWAWLTIPGLLPASLGLAGVGLAFVWCIGLTNAYNFMDGIDGIAGGQAVVAGAVWGIAGLWLGEPSVALVGGCIAAAALGFLVHNRPPARIFMGDVGSATLGFVFAALPLVAAPHMPGVAGRLPLFALLAVWPFVYDAATTFVQRLVHGENVLAPHRSHRYQKLIISGWSHGTVSVIYTCLAAVSAAAGMRWLAAGDVWAGIAGLALVPLVLAAIMALRRLQ